MSVIGVQYFCFLLQPTAVFKALVNQTDFDHSESSLTYDTVSVGAFGDILPGMTMLLGSTNGGDERGRTRMRLAATSTVVHMGWSPKGVRDGEVNPANNAFITVLDDYRVWSRIPKIANDGTVYKDYDLAFNAVTAKPPVSNGGPGAADFIDTVAGTLTVNFNDTTSFGTGNSISSHAWDFVDGTPASAVGSNPGNVAFPPGFRWVLHTVTDTAGNTHTCQIPVFAAEKTGSNAPIPCEVLDRVLTPEGQRIRLRFTQSIPQATYPDGTLVMVWQHVYQNGVKITPPGLTNREQMVFIGWHDTDSADGEARSTGYITSTEIECIDVAGRLAQLPGFTQLIERDAVPATWGQMAGANLDLYLHYLLHWHSTALNLADFTWSGLGSTYPFSVLGSDGGSLYDQVDKRAQAIACRFTCNSYGQLQVKRDPQLVDSGSRTATSQATLTGASLRRVSFTHNRTPRVHWNWGDAIVAGTTDADAVTNIGTVFCRAPGRAPGQGVGEVNSGEQLVVDQDELNSREGHRYAVRLNAFEGAFKFDLANPLPARIEPADMTWITATIDSSIAAERGLVYTATRFLPQEVRFAYDSQHGVQRMSVTAEKEVVGQAAKTYRPPGSNSYAGTTIPTNAYPTTDFTPHAGQFPGWNGAANTIALFGQGANGPVFLTADFQDASPTYSEDAISNWGTISGNVLCAVVDVFSPYFKGTGTAINVWVATTVEIGKVTDVFGTPSYSALHTLSVAPITVPFGISITPSRGIENYVICAWTDVSAPRRIRVAYTTDGTTWAETVIGTTLASGSGDSNPQVWVSHRTPGLAYGRGYTGTTNETALYKSTDSGANWSLVTTPPLPMPSFLNAYVTIMQPVFGNNAELVSFIPNRNGAGTIYLFRAEADGLTVTDITPIFSAVRSTIVRPFGTSWSPTNPNRLVCQLLSSTSQHRLVRSRDNGDTWETVSTGTLYYVVLMTSDNTVIVAGTTGGGTVGLSGDFLDSLQSKAGNLTSLTSANIVGVITGA